MWKIVAGIAIRERGRELINGRITSRAGSHNLVPVPAFPGVHEVNREGEIPINKTVGYKS